MRNSRRSVMRTVPSEQTRARCSRCSRESSSPNWCPSISHHRTPRRSSGGICLKILLISAHRSMSGSFPSLSGPFPRSPGHPSKSSSLTGAFLRTSAASRTACRSLAEESAPRPTGKQCDEDDDRRHEVRGQGNRPLILEVDEEKPTQALRHEDDRCSDAQDPCPPPMEEQPGADREFQANQDHGSPEPGTKLSTEREQYRQDYHCPTEQQDRRRVDVPRDAWCNPRWLDGLGLDTHAGDSTNVCGHP